MKLAILIHGHMRSYKTTHPSFSKVLEDLKKQFDLCDVFIHTWKMQEPETKTWHPGPPHDFENEIITKDNVCNIYNPVKISIEEQSIKDQKKTLKFGLNNVSYEGTKYMWYSFYKANELKKQHEMENNFKYDVVIKIRPDVQFFNSFFIDELISNKKIWYCQIFSKKAASDVVLFSNSENMDRMSDFYLSFDDIMARRDVSRPIEECFSRYLDSLISPVVLSKFVMPRDWRLFRSWWRLDHKTGQNKWDRELGVEVIINDEKYSHFLRSKK